jgi:NAD(P)H dehydrogenase (quinone)
MRIYAIIAHPKKEGLNRTLFNAAINHLKEQGATVDVLDLYERVHDVPFYVPPKTMTPGADKRFDFFYENKERYMAADRLFIVYPVYWYAVPGILKCWLDLITNFAWKFKTSTYALPLCTIKKTLVINTASMPNWYRWFCTRNSATEMMKQSFKFMGLKPYKFYEIGKADKLTEKDIAQHIVKVTSLADWLIDK